MNPFIVFDVEGEAMKTCGDLDGKPCEFLLEFVQTGWSCANGFTRLSEDACAPVLALLEARDKIKMLDIDCACLLDDFREARAEAAKLRSQIDRMTADEITLRAMVHACELQVQAAAAARDDALAEAARWKRAAEVLSCHPRMVDTDSGWPAERILACAYDSTQEDPKAAPADRPELVTRRGWYSVCAGRHVCMRSDRRIPSARSQELAWTWCAVRPMRRPELGNQMSDAYRVLIPVAGYKDTLVEQAQAAAEEIDRLQVQHRLDEGALQEMSEHVRELDEWFREMGWSFVYNDPCRRAAQAVERFLRATVGLPGSSG